ncbi:hypothetical protein J8J32_21065, partial [Mycobacterium tuberculosis]|uniref:hypothetical protein n=1 Tax=Mycobacterium tuberculosis TaxID=1773 RepID=UPI001AE02B9B
MDEIYEEYAAFFPSPNYRIPRQWIDRADAEQELADHSLVGSDFCASTLRDPAVAPVEPEKIKVVPYCYDDTFFASPGPRRRRLGE